MTWPEPFSLPDVHVTVLQHIKNFLVKPEWIAAIALLIQAFILGLQWKILGKHAGTMEEHKNIAEAQAKTAELIGKAVEQQGKILGDQTKIMDEQFKFQRRVEAKVEREKIFGVIVELQSKLVGLQNSLEKLSSGSTIENLETQQTVVRAWNRLEEAILPCEKALYVAMHLSQEEKNYFLQYAQHIDAMVQTRTSDEARNLQVLKNVSNNYKDFSKMLSKAAQTPL